MLLVLLASPALGQSACEDLWHARNQIMDRGGYCFGSALGRSVFNNADCTGSTPQITPAEREAVGAIRAQERALECRIDTSRTDLDLDDLEIRQQLVDTPILDELASGCLGYRGATLPLHAGRSAASDIIGRVEQGDFVLFDHVPQGDWSYVTTHTDNFAALKSGGWLGSGIPFEACAAWAG